MNKPPAIVIKLDYITGLQASRILASYKIPVYGIADDINHFCCRTNSCRKIIEADTAGEELIDALIKLGKEIGRKSVLFPCSDDSVKVISLHREELRDWFHYILPEHEVLELFMDKVKFYKYAQRNGLPIPTTFFPKNVSDIKEISKKISYPCIIKPPRGTRRWYSKVHQKVIKVNNPTELECAYNKSINGTDQPIVQQWIEGDDSKLNSCTFYYNTKYMPVITFASRKLRQFPIENGEICLGEEIRNEEVVKHGTDLMNGINFCGVGSLEMKKNLADQNYYMIEANVCRLPLRFKIVEVGGVELLYTMYLEAIGSTEKTRTIQNYKGVKWISLHRDLMASITYMKKGELTPKEWLKSIRGVNSFGVLSLRDPVPFLIDFPFARILRFIVIKAIRSVRSQIDRLLKRPSS